MYVSKADPHAHAGRVECRPLAHWHHTGAEAGTRVVTGSTAAVGGILRRGRWLCSRLQGWLYRTHCSCLYPVATSKQGIGPGHHFWASVPSSGGIPVGPLPTALLIIHVPPHFLVNLGHQPHTVIACSSDLVCTLSRPQVVSYWLFLLITVRFHPPLPLLLRASSLPVSPSWPNHSAGLPLPYPVHWVQ